MNALELIEQTARDTGADLTPAISPYSTRGWAELRDLTLAPQKFFWGQGLALGQLSAVFGQGGLGKSRISLNLARNQVLGHDFAGLSTGEEPLRHLLMGSENSIHRLQGDVRRMSAGISTDELAALNSHIRMATLETPDDPFITLASPENIARWKATLAAFRPQVLWVDPWGDVLDGEANNDEDTRATLRALRRLLREVDNDAALVVLAHSRTGARNIAQAIGFDAANFGKGSKALYSAARCVWNLAPGDETENPPVVCVLAKNNNGPRVPPFALRLDPETMLYTLDPDFDFEEWQSLVNDRATGKAKRSARNETPLEDYRPALLGLLAAGPLPHGTLFDRAKAKTGLGEKRLERLLADALHGGVIAKSPRLREHGGRVMYGTPEQIQGIIASKLPGAEG